jgi:putative membrane protein
MMWGYDGFGFGGGAMGIGMLLFWGVIIAGVVLVIRALTRSGGSGGSDLRERDKTPLEILRERYARGEIDKAEFEQKRDDLGAS